MDGPRVGRVGSGETTGGAGPGAGGGGVEASGLPGAGGFRMEHGRQMVLT